VALECAVVSFFGSRGGGASRAVTVRADSGGRSGGCAAELGAGACLGVGASLRSADTASRSPVESRACCDLARSAKSPWAFL